MKIHVLFSWSPWLDDTSQPSLKVGVGRWLSSWFILLGQYILISPYLPSHCWLFLVLFLFSFLTSILRLASLGAYQNWHSQNRLHAFSELRNYFSPPGSSHPITIFQPCPTFILQVAFREKLLIQKSEVILTCMLSASSKFFLCSFLQYCFYVFLISSL